MIQKLRALILRVYQSLGAREWLWKLAVRLSVGLMFFGGALKKIAHFQDFVQYFTSLGIPAAKVQAPFVVFVETTASFLLMLGLGTRVAAVFLSGIMVVAILTAGIPENKIHADWSGLLSFLYLSDWLLLLILLWFVFAGAGKASLDALLTRKNPTPT